MAARSPGDGPGRAALGSAGDGAQDDPRSSAGRRVLLSPRCRDFVLIFNAPRGARHRRCSSQREDLWRGRALLRQHLIVGGHAVAAGHGLEEQRLDVMLPPPEALGPLRGIGEPEDPVVTRIALAVGADDHAVGREAGRHALRRRHGPCCSCRTARCPGSPAGRRWAWCQRPIIAWPPARCTRIQRPMTFWAIRKCCRRAEECR